MEEFEELVCDYLKLIPFGRVTTIGEVARISGRPNSTKKVSQIIKENESSFAWYRVVKTDGSFWDGKRRKQKENLLNEGVICEGNKVDLQTYGFYFW